MYPWKFEIWFITNNLLWRITFRLAKPNIFFQLMHVQRLLHVIKHLQMYCKTRYSAQKCQYMYTQPASFRHAISLNKSVYANWGADRGRHMFNNKSTTICTFFQPNRDLLYYINSLAWIWPALLSKSEAIDRQISRTRMELIRMEVDRKGMAVFISL